MSNIVLEYSIDSTILSRISSSVTMKDLPCSQSVS